MKAYTGNRAPWQLHTTGSKQQLHGLSIVYFTLENKTVRGSVILTSQTKCCSSKGTMGKQGLHFAFKIATLMVEF